MGLRGRFKKLFDWALCSFETVHYAIHTVLKLHRLRVWSQGRTISERAVLKLFIMLSVQFRNCSKLRNCSALRTNSEPEQFRNCLVTKMFTTGLGCSTSVPEPQPCFYVQFFFCTSGGARNEDNIVNNPMNERCSLYKKKWWGRILKFTKNLQ